MIFSATIAVANLMTERDEIDQGKRVTPESFART